MIRPRLPRALQATLDALSDRQWHHGADLARQFGTKPHAVWNRVERLRDRGHGIEGYGRTKALGYRLIYLASEIERRDHVEVVERRGRAA